ncbi:MULTISPECIES: excisionase family protein [Shewanella]|nr:MULTISPECIES: excisionase family protein [unclassified Shewanella]MCG9964571.1 excisionase family protein [Shewanella sp. PS-2]MCH7421256.1 excisionase family protein [Shewanella sp. MM_2022_3]
MMAKQSVETTPAKWVRGNLLPTVFGITSEAARKYRERGVWLEGRQWRYDPVNRVVYNVNEIERWMEGVA